LTRQEPTPEPRQASEALKKALLERAAAKKGTGLRRRKPKSDGRSPRGDEGMPKNLYRVTLQREITETQEYEFETEAHSEEEAKRMALDHVRHEAFNGWQDGDTESGVAEIVETEEA